MSLDKLVEQIDQTINRETESLLEKFGYQFHESMTLEEFQALALQLRKDNLFLNIKTRQKKKEIHCQIRLTKLLTFTL